MAAEPPLSRLTGDLLAEILRRVDGPTLASAACACTDLRGAAREEALWEELCHDAWPSTAEKNARSLISSMPGGFTKFYADSLPLLSLYRPQQEEQPAVVLQEAAESHDVVAPQDLVSLVDIYYKGMCVLSRVVHDISVHDPKAWFLECPFKLEALRATTGANGQGQEDDNGINGPLPPPLQLQPKEEGGVGVLNWMLEEDLRLSWVLIDVKRGRAVNLSGGKPSLVQSNWPSNGDLLLRFGCVVPVERRLLLSGAVAECVVSVRCRLSQADDCLMWAEVGLQVEDMEGAHVDGHRSLAVLERALGCTARTRDHRAVEEGYRAYTRDRRAMRERWMRREGVLEKVFALSSVALFAALCLSML